MILLSLTISDCLQISLVAFIQLMALLSDLKTVDVSCQVLRKIVEVVAVLTMVTSSGSILALSVERYVACIYCFRVHHIVSHKRVQRALYAVWGLSVVCSFLDEKRYRSSLTSNSLPLTPTSRAIYGFIVIISTVILTCIQISLYRLARKLIRVHPGSSFGSNAEANDLRRDQLRSSIAASAVVVLYVVCMCPLAIYMLVMFFEELDVQSDARLFCIFLAQINTFVDPFVYGFGMEDTRRSIKREMRKMKSFFQEILHY